AVADFDHFRAPLSADERRRRQAAELTARQSALLERYGYPYVLDEFRLHFTLSGHAPAPFRDGLLRAIDALYARAVGSTPVVANGLSLFRQEDSTSRFRIVETFPFAQGASAAASTRGPVGVPAS
ncbi:MAG TPA: DUF1045 domain-containing protein, partial [Roseiarcus sp.]|nr:DUF1045 domain-containing protein [Roseiarcus sp.]